MYINLNTHYITQTDFVSYITIFCIREMNGICLRSVFIFLIICASAYAIRFIGDINTYYHSLIWYSTNSDSILMV